MSDDNKDRLQIPAEGIEVTSGFGYNDRKPYVQLLEHKQDWYIQLDAEAAMELALRLYEAALHSQQDEFIVKFMTEAIQVEFSEAVKYLILMRQFREGGEIPEFWKDRK